MKIKAEKLAGWLKDYYKAEKVTLAVTGQMAAGKNYVCSLLEQSGWNSVDADKLVHKAIELSKEKILETFSKEADTAGLKLLNEDGSVNRRAIGEIVFGNRELLAKQEAIVYPVIEKMIQEFIENNSRAIINATVLYKTPALLSECDAVLFVTAPFFIRLWRAKKRDKLPLIQILRRFRNQKELLKKYKEQNIKVVIVRNV